MKIIQERDITFITAHELIFYRLESSPATAMRDGCFGFACDKEGNVFEQKLADNAKVNLAKLRAGTMTGYHKKPFIHSYESKTIIPAIGQCECGAHVNLEHFTNTCDKCGRDYNSSGTLLAPRSEWGQETGESASDILNIP